MRDMTQHFNEISASYNELRTTDPEPIDYIKEQLSGKETIRGVDIGCGSGRYDLLMLQKIPDLHLTCTDLNKAMVDETEKYLRNHGQCSFTTKVMDAEKMDISPGSLDFVSSFNAIHHFSLPTFVENASKVLNNNGRIFIYTRLQSQNRQSIWGKYFPKFTEKENRLLELAQVDNLSDQIVSARLESIRFFQFKRDSSLKQLIGQAEGKHYSTFSLYSDDEFRAALLEFEENIQKIFSDLDKVEWLDENVLFTFCNNL